MQRAWGWLSLVGAAVALVVSVAALKWYLWDVVIGQAGEPDRSMLFWGLPVALLGVSSLAVAGVLGWAARSMLRRPRR